MSLLHLSELFNYFLHNYYPILRFFRSPTCIPRAWPRANAKGDLGDSGTRISKCCRQHAFRMYHTKIVQVFPRQIFIVYGHYVVLDAWQIAKTAFDHSARRRRSTGSRSWYQMNNAPWMATWTSIWSSVSKPKTDSNRLASNNYLKRRTR